MNPIDLVFIVLTVGFSIFGYKKGFIREVGAIISLLVSLIFAYIFSKPFSLILANYIQGLNQGLVQFISFLTILIGGTILFYMFFIVFKRIINITLLGIVDSLLGMGLGILKTAIILLVVYSILMWKPIYNATKKTTDKSFAINTTEKYLPYIKTYWGISYKKIKESKLIENVQKNDTGNIRIQPNSGNN
ncbi:CvpA family protein [candidate division WOR-3 bacterium]|jgi:membrane protein required for colicin V production|nr:CvpA family protein [candidate division WOR-3 bacterium]